MRKLILAVAVLVSSMTMANPVPAVAEAQTQPIKLPTMRVSSNLGALMAGALGARFDYSLPQKGMAVGASLLVKAFDIGFPYYLPNITDNYAISAGFNMRGAIVGHLFDSALYIESNLWATYLWQPKALGFQGDALLGYEHTLGNGLFFDLGIGVMAEYLIGLGGTRFNVRNFKRGRNEESRDGLYWYPTATIAVGYAW